MCFVTNYFDVLYHGILLIFLKINFLVRPIWKATTFPGFWILDSGDSEI